MEVIYQNQIEFELKWKLQQPDYVIFQIHNKLI